MWNSSGTVLIDSNGMVLLRRPSGGYGGYSWTFSKGRVDPGESLENAAVRETFEETGYSCSIISKIGDFVGSESMTTYYLARPDCKVTDPGWETEELQWFRPNEARNAIETTSNLVGRKRDLDVLTAALRVAGFA